MTYRRPTAVDLFSGAGGMSLGFEQAGFDIVAAVEIDPIHCATHEYNFPNCPVFCGSVKDLSAVALRSRFGIKADIDCVMGGPPCQGVSLIGDRAIDDPRNLLMTEFVRLAAELEPKYIVMENVAGLTVGNHKQLLDKIVADLRRATYNVVEPIQVMDAAQFGVPQERRRVILVAARNDQNPATYPPAANLPAGTANGLEPQLLDLPHGPTVADALNDLPNADDYDVLLSDDSVTVTFGSAAGYALRLRTGIDPDSRGYRRLFDQDLLTSSLRTVHSDAVVRRFAETLPGKVEEVSRYTRLDSIGICSTLRAGTGSDHGAFTAPRPIHPMYNRCLTVREAARLHSYPDWFRFHVTKWHGFRQVGNSVPPLLARAIANQLVRALGMAPTAPSEAIALGETALLRLNATQAAERYEICTEVLPRRKRKLNGLAPDLLSIPGTVVETTSSRGTMDGVASAPHTLEGGSLEDRELLRAG